MKKVMKKSTKSKGLGASSIAVLILCVISIFTIKYYNDEIFNAMGYQTNLNIYLRNFEDASKLLTEEVRAYATTGNRKHYDNYMKEVNVDDNRGKMVAKMKETGLNSKEISLIDNFFSVSNRLVPMEKRAITLAENGDLAGATAIVYGGDYEKGIEDIKSTIAELSLSIKKRTNELVKNKYNKLYLFLYVSYICIFLEFVAQICYFIFIRRAMLNPMAKIQKKMLDFANGKLDSKFDLQEDTSEVGQTAKAINDMQKYQMEIISDIKYLLNAMADGNFAVKTTCEQNYIGDYKEILLALRQINQKLSYTLSEIGVVAEQVEVGSTQVSDAAQGLAQGATEQASTIEELNATVETVSNQMQQTALETDRAAGLVVEAENSLNRSIEEMNMMAEAMKNIENKANDIGKIIKTIDDIAFQTNILALNAAVEAARAGVAGKGFAVVADEVRNLAQKSAEAAKNTTTLIDEAVMAVTNGAKIVDTTQEAVVSVVESTKKVSEIVFNIKKSSNEEAQSAIEISQNVDQISAVVQTNSATSQQTAASSEELSSQANMLKSLVMQFNLRKDVTNDSFDNI